MSTVDLVVLLVLLLTAICQMIAFRRLEEFGADSSVYITLAENLAEGRDYVFNEELHRQYPPGFPFILAAIGAFTGSMGYESWITWMPLMGLAGFGMWYLVLQAAAGREISAGACVLTATSPPVFSFFSSAVMSEGAYMLLSAAAVACLLSLPKAPAGRVLRLSLSVTGITLVAVTAMVRSVGVALAAGLVIWVLLQHSGRTTRGPIRVATAAAVATMLTLAAWGAWVKGPAAAGTEYYASSYDGQFMQVDPHEPDRGRASVLQIAARVRTMLPVQAAHLAELVFHVGWVNPLWYSPVVLGFVVLVAAGILSSGADPARGLISCYLAAYLALVSVWPFDEGVRFILPVAPLAIVIASWGWRAIASWLRGHQRNVAAVSGVACIAVAAFAASTTSDGGKQSVGSIALLGALGAATLWTARGAVELRVLARAVRTLRMPLLVGVAVIVAVSTLSSWIDTTARNVRASDHGQAAAIVNFAHWLESAPPGPAMAQKYHVLHRLVRRRVTPFPPTSVVNDIVARMRSERTRYLLVAEPGEFTYLRPSETDRVALIERDHPGLLRLVHVGPGFRVYEHRPGAVP